MLLVFRKFVSHLAAFHCIIESRCIFFLENSLCKIQVLFVLRRSAHWNSNVVEWCSHVAKPHHKVLICCNRYTPPILFSLFFLLFFLFFLFFYFFSFFSKFHFFSFFHRLYFNIYFGSQFQSKFNQFFFKLFLKLDLIKFLKVKIKKLKSILHRI